MPKMVCAKDGYELYPEKNGVYEIVFADFGPYQIYRADLWRCSGCGAEILAGFAPQAIFEIEHDGFKECLEKVKLERHYPNYGRAGEYKPK